MATKKTAVAKRPKAAVAEKLVVLHAPPLIPAVTRGEGDAERHYLVNPNDGTVAVPASEEKDFLKMGFARSSLRDPVPPPRTMPARPRPVVI